MIEVKIKCKIYEYRPLGCRLYPLIYDPKTDSVIVNEECPQASQISKEDIKNMKNRCTIRKEVS